MTEFFVPGPTSGARPQREEMGFAGADGGSLSTATIANLTLGRRDLLGSWLPGLDGWASFYNIFDQHYADPAPGEIDQDAIEQDGFTFRLQLRCAFQP